MKFKAEVLRDNIPIGTLNLIAGDIKYNSTARIKRAASITVEADVINSNTGILLSGNLVYPSIDLYPGDNLLLKSGRSYSAPPILNKMKDRIRIMIDDQSVGKFMVVSSPKKSNGKITTYEMELYDESYKLDEANLSHRLYFESGTLYLDAIKTILTEYGYECIIADEDNHALQLSREWELGENVMDIINELLKEINFNNFFIDDEGVARLTKKAKHLTPTHVYRDGQCSILLPDLSQNEDIYKIPNVFVGVVSRPESEPIIYRKVNDDPNSSVSTIGRGFEIAYVETLSDIASEEELKKYIDDLYLQSIQIVEKIEFTTKIEPDHIFEELVQIDTKSAAGLFKEISWDIELSNSGFMKHTAERKVYQ